MMQCQWLCEPILLEFVLFIHSSPNLRSSVLLFQSKHFIAGHSSHYEPRELHVSLDHWGLGTWKRWVWRHTIWMAGYLTEISSTTGFLQTHSLVDICLKAFNYFYSIYRPTGSLSVLHNKTYESHFQLEFHFCFKLRLLKCFNVRGVLIKWLYL